MANKSYYHSPLQLIVSLWLITSSAAFLVYSLANPMAEWDMVAYAASAEALDTTDYELIHSRVYGELRERLTEEEYNTIAAGNSYRQRMHEDAQAFGEQLPFYSIRITFNTLLATLRDFGISVFDAGHWVTAVGYIVALLVLWGSLNDRIHPVLQMLFPVMFYKYSMDLEVTRQILADSLASVWVVFLCIAYLRKSGLLLALIAFSVFIRVDLIIFSGLLLLLLFITSERKNYLSLFFCSLVLLASYLVVQQWAGNYGWSTLYYFAIISDMLATHPSEYGKIGFTLFEYLNSLVRQEWVSKMYLVTALFSIAILVAGMVGLAGDFNKRVCRISAVCLLYIVVHYLIFPQMYLRFFVAQNLMIYAGFAILCTHYWRVIVGDERKNVRLHAENRFNSADSHRKCDAP